MKKWLKRLQAWRTQRGQFSPESWERIRAKGKARFVVRTALIVELTLIVGVTISDYLFDGRIQLSKIPFRIIFFLFFAILIGLSEWSNREAKYNNARLKDDVKRRLSE